MSSEQNLYVYPKRWPFWFNSLLLLALAAFWALSPSGLPGASFLFLGLFALQSIESTWRRQAFFAFKREDDAFFFWLALVGCVVLLGFAAFMFYVLQIAP